MSRDWRLYLDDMVNACEKVGKFTAGLDRPAFFQDERRTTPSSATSRS